MQYAIHTNNNMHTILTETDAPVVPSNEWEFSGNGLCENWECKVEPCRPQSVSKKDMWTNECVHTNLNESIKNNTGAD